jgi:hypothetical protein
MIELSPGAFWEDKPLAWDPAPRAVKQEHFWQSEFDLDYSDSDLEGLYSASPRPPAIEANVEDLIHSLEDLFSAHPSNNTDPEYSPPPVSDDSDFEYVRHPELREQTPLSEVADDLESETNHSSSYDFLCCVSDSPDPLSLCLFPSYLSAFNELSLLSFLGHIDPCKPFEPRTLKEAQNSTQWPM